MNDEAIGQQTLEPHPVNAATFSKPPAVADVIIGATGHGTTAVDITDLGEMINGNTYFAHQARARIYPAGQSPSPGDQDTAAPLTLADPQNHRWEKVDVADADCNSAGTASNTAYVWMWYMASGMPPPPPVMKAYTKGFSGKCSVMAVAAEAVERDGAKKRKSSKARAQVLAQIASAKPKEVGRWLKYEIPTNAGPEGTRLLGADGKPLRVGRIAVFAHRVSWLSDREDSKSVVTRALGNYRLANSAWRFSSAYQHSLVLWQIYGRLHMIASQEKDYPLLLELDGRSEIFVHVNSQLVGDEYSNNKRSVGISVRVIA